MEPLADLLYITSWKSVSLHRKILHGLDNITADGLKAVEVLTKTVSKMQTFGLSEERVEQLNSLLSSVNQHLKFEMKGHLNIESWSTIMFEHSIRHTRRNNLWNFSI